MNKILLFCKKLLDKNLYFQYFSKQAFYSTQQNDIEIQIGINSVHFILNSKKLYFIQFILHDSRTMKDSSTDIILLNK